MGWWSATIMGGDTPLDELAGLCRVAGVPWGPDTKEDDEDYNYDIPDFHLWLLERRHVEENIDALLDYVRKQTTAYSHQQVAGQVLGAMVLWTGAEISTETLEELINWAADDDWAADGDYERQQHMASFIDALKSHRPGAPTKLPEEGLFKKIEEMLS